MAGVLGEIAKACTGEWCFCQLLSQKLTPGTLCIALPSGTRTGRTLRFFTSGQDVTLLLLSQYVPLLTRRTSAAEPFSLKKPFPIEWMPGRSSRPQDWLEKIRASSPLENDMNSAHEGKRRYRDRHGASKTTQPSKPKSHSNGRTAHKNVVGSWRTPSPRRSASPPRGGPSSSSELHSTRCSTLSPVLYLYCTCLLRIWR